VACWAFTVRLFHSLRLASLPGAVCIALLEGGCYCPQSTRCLRTGLTLRHVTPEWELRRDPALAEVNVCKLSNLAAWRLQM
jgi:hypothetical protein